METAERALAAALSELKASSSLLAEKEQAFASASKQHERLEAKLKGERKALAAQLRAAYLLGQREQTKLLLSQQNAQNVGRLLTFYEYFTRARTQGLAAVVADSRKLAEQAKTLQSELQALTVVREQQQAAVTAEQALKRQRMSILSAMNERIGDEQDQLKRLTADERDMEKALELVRSTLADLPVATPKTAERDGNPARSFAQGRGRLAWPLRGGLLARYGDPKVGGKLIWKGWWIAADRGAPVKAAARGRVAHVGYMHRYGLIVIVEHEDGYFTLYGHLNEADTSAGATVALGERLGTTGDSGGHQRTGLYFEVRKGTEPLDPKDWLAP
jgi:septal ring factor EnvC (AmiA/AmiB activator)